MRERITFLAAGLCAALLIVGAFLFFTRGGHMRIEGRILKVRTHPADESSTVAIVDFRFANPAAYTWMVKKVDVVCDMKDGSTIESTTVSDMDATRLLDYFKELGGKYNDTLRVRDKIPAGQSWDRMVAARFEVPESKIEQRSRFRLRVQESDGNISELVEGPR